MRGETAKPSDAFLKAVLRLVCILVVTCFALGQNPVESVAVETTGISTGVELARYENEYSTARLEPVRKDKQAGIAVIFEGTDDLHYYASPGTAPAPGFELKIEANSDNLDFGKAVFPEWEIITDPVGSKVEVYKGNFIVFLPVTAAKAQPEVAAIEKLEVKITGITCTSMLCLPPFEKTLQTKIDWSKRDSWRQFTVSVPTREKAAISVAKGPDYSTWFALVLAFLAGVILNIMPCVLPVIPLKVLSIFEQARESKARCIALGLSFCLGILLFFAALAALNIILRLGYGTVFQWGDHFRNPAFLIGMALLLVVLALFMFDVFAFGPPSSVADKAGPRKGLAGSVAMGFLAAILSTPCRFAILTAAFAWAQTQRLPLATIAIMLIGVGMAAPYAILTSIPSLLKYLPRAGRWTELFKQTMGFVLLIVAVWLLTALPEERGGSVLYFGVVLAFCVWMWGGWVTLSTPAARKWIIRIVAVAIAVAAGFWLLPAREANGIDWKEYDSALVSNAIAEQKPVLIEFMADWCLTCKAVEKTVYSKKDITDLIERKGVLPIRGDTTLRDSEAAVDLQNVYQEPGVPVSILYLPEQKEPVRLHGLLIADKLRELLVGLPDKQ